MGSVAKLAGIITTAVIVSVCTGELLSSEEGPEPLESDPNTVSSLLASLPSVITVLGKTPVFVEWFTTRPVLFTYPKILANHTLLVKSSDTAVATIGGDGWVDLSVSNAALAANVSGAVFANLTLSHLVIFDHSNNASSNDTKWIDNEMMDDSKAEIAEKEAMRSDEALLKVIGNLLPKDLEPMVANFTLIGHRFGRVTLSLELYHTKNGQLQLDPEMTQLAKVIPVMNMRIPTAFDIAFGTTMLVFSAVVTGIMGCELEWDPVKKILKRPFGLIIGFFSQFVIMPLTAFVMCVAFDLPSAHAIGIILSACSPGGGLSNMTSVAIDANLLLSIAMTFFSTVLALAMMPLNIFIYSRRFQDEDSFPIPFTKIIIGLVAIVTPLAAGCLLRRFKKAWALKLLRILKPVSLVIILFAVAGGVYTIRFVFTYIVADMIACSFSIPFIAFFLGGTSAIICRRGFREVKTIAIETAVQNIAIAAGIVRLVYPPLESDILSCTIMWTLLGQLCLITLLVVGFTVYKKLLKERFGAGRKKLENVEEVDDDGDKGAEMVPLDSGDEDIKSVTNGSAKHAHLDRLNKTPSPTAGMTMGAYRFWGYKPLTDEEDGNGNKAGSGLFVTFPSGVPGVTATQMWAPPIVGPTGDIWVPNPELFGASPESTV